METILVEHPDTVFELENFTELREVHAVPLTSNFVGMCLDVYEPK